MLDTQCVVYADLPVKYLFQMALGFLLSLLNNVFALW